MDLLSLLPNDIVTLYQTRYSTYELQHVAHLQNSEHFN